MLKWIWRGTLTLAFLALCGAGVVGVAVWEHYSRDLPDSASLRDYQPPTMTRVHAGDGRLLAEYAIERRIFVPVSAMPPLIIRSFIAAEDKNFWSHQGIDPVGMARAVLQNLGNLGRNKRPIGASTITQQVARNFFLTNEVSIERKIKEAILALRLEQTLSKDRILELYLNEIYLGRGSYGVAAAALNYFNHSLDELTVGEAAYLAALPKAPSNYDPVRNLEQAKGRRDYGIGRMLEDGSVTQEQATAAIAEPLEIRRRDPEEVVRADYFAEEGRR